jgi:hypothetical protein
VKPPVPRKDPADQPGPDSKPGQEPFSKFRRKRF